MVEPVSERLSTVEQEQDNVSKQIKVISDELKELKEELKNRQTVRQSATSEVHAPRQMIIQTQVSDRSESQTQKDNTVSNELLEIISLGRRTIGLQKIDEADLIRMRQDQYGGANTEEEEKLLPRWERLRCRRR